MTQTARILVAVQAILLSAIPLCAEEKPIIGFTFHVDGGNGTFRLADHTLFFNEGEHAEASVTLTDEQVAQALLLLTSNPMIAAKFAKKPAGKVVMECHLVRAGGAGGDRYLTEVDVEDLEKDLEAKAKASADDPKSLALLDQQSELFPYLSSLATAGKPPRNAAPAKP